jgi:superfamily I DNA/RNA helicase
MSRPLGESFENWEQRITDCFEDAIRVTNLNTSKRSGHKHASYDAILIDEGQDFTVDMVKGLANLLNENTDSLLFCYDPSQNVFGRETPRWKDAGLKVQGKRPIELRTSYRNTSEIMTLATRFAKIPSQQDIALESALVPTNVERHGNSPVMNKCRDDDHVCEYILNEIDNYIRKRLCDWSDIGILYANRYEDFPMSFNAAFYDRFKFGGNERLFWVNQTNEMRHALDLASPSAKMCTIESSKGLEFKVVFFVGMDLMPRNKRDHETERKLAYVAMTRAQEYLHIPCIRDSLFVEEVEQLLR